MAQRLRVWGCLLAVAVGIAPSAVMHPPVRPAALPSSSAETQMPRSNAGIVAWTSKAQIEQLISRVESSQPKKSESALTQSLRGISPFGAAFPEVQLGHQEISHSLHATTISATNWTSSLGASVLVAMAAVVSCGYCWLRQLSAVKNRNSATEAAASSKRIAFELPKFATAALASAELPAVAAPAPISASASLEGAEEEVATSLMDTDMYQKQLVALQRIRELANGADLCLPQIVVMGDQSSGKSSLLTELSGVCFPVNSGICTKAPIVVQCTHNPKLPATRYMVGDKVVEYDDLMKEIEDVQSEALKESTRIIVSKEIRVHVEGPEQIDVILIDLPGIINQGEGKQETRELIKAYIEQEQTLIMLVSEAKQDDELVSAIELAREADPKKRRTMRVLTKFDTFDSSDARDRASQLVREDEFAHAVVCRWQGGEYDAKLEMSHLIGELDLPEAQAGVEALKKRLPRIFGELINVNLANLEVAIGVELEEAQWNLARIRKHPMSKPEMVGLALQTLQKSSGEFEMQISEFMESFQASVHASKKTVEKQWVDSKYHPNAFKNPFFQGESAVDACMMEICTKWKEPLDELLCSVNDHAKDHVSDALVFSTELPDAFIDTVRTEWQESWKGSLIKLTTMCEQERVREIDFGTMNHYITAKFMADTILPDEAIKEIAGVVKSMSDKDVRNAGEIVVKLRELRAMLENKYEAQSINDQQKERVFRAVKAVVDVETKTFIDNILKTIRDIVICERHRWVNLELTMNEKILESAVEDLAVIEKRKSYTDTIARMEACLTELKAIAVSNF